MSKFQLLSSTCFVATLLIILLVVATSYLYRRLAIKPFFSYQKKHRDFYVEMAVNMSFNYFRTDSKWLIAVLGTFVILGSIIIAKDEHDFSFLFLILLQLLWSFLAIKVFSFIKKRHRSILSNH